VKEEQSFRLALGVPVFAVILIGSHVIGHPVPWWLAALAALVIVFLGEWIFGD
jgi:hypothetical protein